ncbi:MAG: Carboxy-terminal processing protease CtpB [Candidatus Ordinivivax streblomastigis]|uniref:Carboxy-terminal processing protease CtpB n=1 Tax=Candidatus Ordinivivax streblomastigis TaxID=2540710 RepID=A0A5M8P5H2_9BACT|nr:MAG: Carboxy-terminal processing protease CtpB [Candidatus Ordinivivax streblomastigis]
MRSKKTVWWIICSIIISLITGIIVGDLISVKSFGRKLFLTPNNKVNVILDIINEDYVDPVNMREITEGAIANIIDELDPHSLYISGSELQDVNEDMDGHFGGIGVNYFLYKDTVVIVNVQHGGPSSQAGLMPGDRIVHVNDLPFAGSSITNDKIFQTLRGPIGSSVKLHIRHPNSDTLATYTLRRSSILMTTVKAACEPEKGIGYIKIFDKFSHTTYDEFVQAITTLVSQGCKSFIIDLRMNSGGSYDAAIQIINEFLPAGKMIVYAEGKSFPRQESIADGSGTLPDNQVVVLIDQLSASASEIVAGAIQDNDRGLIIGRRSFGKGLVQNQIELSDGSAVRLTIARYFTPSGRNIQRKYALGKTTEYNQDWLHQLNNGEGYHADSIKMDTTTTYKTVHGRTVYGNGGIMPDIFVPLDTAHMTPYYIQLENKDVFNKYAFEYSDANRAVLSTFPNYRALWAYLKTQPIFYDFIRYAEANGVKRRTNQINRSSNQISLSVYAYIIHNFFGEEAFYQVYLSNDPVILRAIQAIQKGESLPQAIAARK